MDAVKLEKANGQPGAASAVSNGYQADLPDIGHGALIVVESKACPK